MLYQVREIEVDTLGDAIAGITLCDRARGWRGQPVGRYVVALGMPAPAEGDCQTRIALTTT